MFVSYTVHPLDPNQYPDASLRFEEITQCPLCHKDISPIFLNGFYRVSGFEAHIECHLFCKGCKHSFIGSYFCKDITNENAQAIILSAEPHRHEKQSFDKVIETISPQFTNIYNQSLAAEFAGLNEIAGLGYRKSLEFLIKDFAIHKNPDNEDLIKKFSLARCIKDYIDNPQIKVLAERSAWLENDEAHYVRKHIDRDIVDMKRFIMATVYFISMILISEDAESINPRQ